MKIAIGCDHIGLFLKQSIGDFLRKKNYDLIDYGTYSAERTDYPIYGYKVAKAVSVGIASRGLLFCGTGVGISLSANKVENIRCVVCSDIFSAKLSREHNDSNILSLGSRVVGYGLAEMIVETWLNSEYDEGRHQRRIDMISDIEKGKFII